MSNLLSHMRKIKEKKNNFASWRYKPEGMLRCVEIWLISFSNHNIKKFPPGVSEIRGILRKCHNQLRKLKTQTINLSLDDNNSKLAKTFTDRKHLLS